MELKAILGDELFEQVTAKIEESDGDIKLMVNDGSFVPRDRLNAKTEEIDALRSQIESRDQQIEDLRDDSKMTKSLRERIEELQEENKTAKAEMEERLAAQTLDAAIERSLLQNGARNPKAVRALLDASEIKIDGDDVKGLDDQIATIKESEPYLFDDGKPRQGGSQGFSGDKTSPLTAAMIAEMSPQEINERWDDVEKFLENNRE